MSGGFNLDDYVDVAERIRLFYERYEDGRIDTVEHGLYHVGERTFVWCHAKAFRTPDDPIPGSGTAWEPIPGPTPYTKDSELMNAETAAWGRAIIAAGIPSKKIASAEEVAARRVQPAGGPAQDHPPTASKRTDAQNRKMRACISELDKSSLDPPDGSDDWAQYAKRWIFTHFGKESSKDLTKAEAGKLIDDLEAQAVPFG